VLPELLENSSPSEKAKYAGDLTKTTIESLNLKVNTIFGYLFDYGDGWMHQITVKTIDESVPKGRFPRIINKTGDSPPQYIDEEE
jgi:hypothetical protein